MVLRLLNFILLLVSASALVTPPCNRVINHGRRMSTNYIPSHCGNALVPVSRNSCRSSVSLAVVPIESNIIASAFAATVGYIMWQEAKEISEKKKHKRAVISMGTQERVEFQKARSDQSDPGDEGKTKSDRPEESIEPLVASNDVNDSKLGNIENKIPVITMEPVSMPSDPSQVEESKAFSDVVATEKEKVKQAGSDILDIKKSIASTLQGERDKVDRLQAGSGDSAQEVSRSPQKTKIEVNQVVADDVVDAPVSGRKRTYIRRSIKKIVMPWKKWSNL